jgi:hypothetical protein
MGNCLVTKLSGVTGNVLLPKLGELSLQIKPIDSPSEKSQKISLIFNAASDLRVVGGSFVDSALSTDKGANMHVDGGIADIYLKNIASNLFIGNKYALTQISIDRAAEGFSFDLSQLKYSKDMKVLLLGSAKVDNISEVSNFKKLTDLTCFSCNDILDISNIKDLPLINIGFGGNKNITGDIANFPATALNITINDTDIYGNYESVLGRKLTSLASIFRGTRVGGDLSKMPSTETHINASKNPSVFSWKTERDNFYKIVSLEGAVNFGDDLDAMLINQAKCQIGFVSSDESYKKLISCLGNRTSASDSAIQTLKGKGYNVYVNNVQM